MLGVVMSKKHKPVKSRFSNLAYTTLAGQAGVAAMVIVFGAMFLGLWLDSLVGVKGPFTVSLLVLSIPLSLYTMLRIVLGAIGQISPPTPPQRQSTQEEDLSLEDNFERRPPG